VIGNQGIEKDTRMKYNLVATTLAAAVTIAVPTLAFANSHHHHRYRHPIAIQGYGVPMTYRDLNRTYPTPGYDPDHDLESALRKDGMIDFPGIGR
jgi:hypothetical protein